jgi:hypothetical protein
LQIQKECSAVQVFHVGPGIVDVNNIDAYAVNTDWKKVFLDKENFKSRC